VTDRRGASADGLFALAVAIAIVATAAMRLQRPIIRTVDDTPPPAATRPWPDMRVDLNTAHVGELAALPGIGPRLSERIVEDRALHGPFETVDDLQRVHRVGPVLVADIREHVVAGQAAGGE
jgi:competence ComEA-like helix-hairpin-helix protein